jgi:hypothetical protein
MSIKIHRMRKVWRYQRDNQKSSIEEGQTIHGTKGQTIHGTKGQTIHGTKGQTMIYKT